MTDLAHRRCEPCNAETPPIEGNELERYREHLQPRWRVVDEHHLTASFSFEDFAGALAFTSQVGRIVEEEGHHPEICLSWGRAKVRLWTHAIDGLSENDFIVAAKIDRLLGGSPHGGGSA